MDEWELGRIRRDARPILPFVPGAASTPAFIGKVVTASPAVGKFFLATPSRVFGAEQEGGPATFTDAASPTIPVYLIGPGVPLTGDYLVCKFVEHRWVAERSGGGVGGNGNLINLYACDCPVPATLSMTSASTTCNFGMFQSCPLEYLTAPACFAPLDITGSIFISTTTFVDFISGASFYYWLYCANNLYTLSRLFCVSPYGSPFRDSGLYTWQVGGYGNSCTPFFLHNGNAYPGSDASCNVKIDPA